MNRPALQAWWHGRSGQRYAFTCHRIETPAELVLGPSVVLGVAHDPDGSFRIVRAGFTFGAGHSETSARLLSLFCTVAFEHGARELHVLPARTAAYGIAVCEDLRPAPMVLQ